jgi:hypothetical protein
VSNSQFLERWLYGAAGSALLPTSTGVGRSLAETRASSAPPLLSSTSTRIDFWCVMLKFCDENCTRTWPVLPSLFTTLFSCASSA